MVSNFLLSQLGKITRTAGHVFIDLKITFLFWTLKGSFSFNQLYLDKAFFGLPWPLWGRPPLNSVSNKAMKMKLRGSKVCPRIFSKNVSFEIGKGY